MRASALLRESLKSALNAKGFDVDAQQTFAESAIETQADLIICEVTGESEALARRLISELPDVALILVGPISSLSEGDSQKVGRRRNVRELSADVSVAEVVQVCQQQLFGTAPGSIPKPAASRTSAPFSVLPRPSDPPSYPSQAISSSPAPLLTVSKSPSSQPSGASLLPPSIPPPAFASFARPSLSAGGHELSHELAQLLDDADQRVAARMRPRLSLPPAPEPTGPEAPLRMSPEIRAALEDPIGDYEVAAGSEIPRSAVPQTQATMAKSEPAQNASDRPGSATADAQTGTGLPLPEPQRSTDDGLLHAEEESQPARDQGPPSPDPAGVNTQAARNPAHNTIVPGSESRTRHPRPATADSAVPDSGRGTDAAPPEPTTARPPAPSQNRTLAETPRPRRPPTPLPPDPLLPRGNWVQSALGRPQAGTESELIGKGGRGGGISERRKSQAAELRDSQPPRRARASNPTKPGSLQPETQRPTLSDGTARGPEPTNAAGVLELSQQELPPLGVGDGVRVLARAIRTRFSGAVAFEADGGIRRIVLRDGDLVTASSSVNAESLLAFLVERGRLESEVSHQLEHKLPTFGRHAGAALIASGHLAQDQLWPVLRAHAEFVAGQALSLDHGLAAYESTVPERLQAEPSVFGGATGAEVLIEILRRTVGPDAAVARLGGPSVRLSSGPNMNLLDECALPPDELEHLERVGQVPLEEVLSRVPNPEFSSVLLGLVELQVLSLARDTRWPRRNKHQEVFRDRLDDEALRKAIQVRKALVEDGDYFAVLGLTHGATGYDVRRAYLELKRQFDQSVALTPATADLSDDVELILEVVEEAYSILHDQLKRERYRRAIESVPHEARG